MIEILSISVAILAVALVGLVIYIFKLNKEKQFLDKDNDPDYIKLQKDYEGLEKEKNLKDQYISDLKNDKQELIKNRTDVDSFKEISNKSFQEYQAVVSEYKNFHEKLTGDAKYQGRFNELKLRRILEKHGFKQEDGDFDERKGQKNIDPVTGKERRVMPDFILNLPENEKIIIDCKVSLKAFEEFANSKDKQSRENFLKKHIESVKTHIDELSNKDYLKIYNLQSFQYIVMFMPFDACYLAILEKEQESILDKCFEKKILLAGPISIMGLISTASSIKNQKKQISKVGEIIKKVEDIFDKYSILKDSLRTAISSHRTHTKALEEVINTSYGSNQGLESKLKKLRDEHGLNTRDLKISTENDKKLDYIRDPEREEKKVINYKN